MKRFLVASALFAIATAASAGLTYKVQSNTTGVRPMTLGGTVSVDGSRMRFDVVSGDGMLFKDNSTVLSSDGGKTMSVFDPSTHNYYDLHLEQLLGTSTSMLNSLGNGQGCVQESACRSSRRRRWRDDRRLSDTPVHSRRVLRHRHRCHGSEDDDALRR